MQSVQYNLEFTKAMLEELESYLRSPQLFWPLSKSPHTPGPAFPRLTPGALLLAIDELEARVPEMSDGELADFQELKANFEGLQAKHRMALERKSLQEAQQRLSLWRAHLADLQEQAQAISEYPQQVRNRVMFERLMDLIVSEAEKEAARAKIGALDRQLRSRFAHEDFVWAAGLKPAYPAETYWYLYGHPRA